MLSIILTIVITAIITAIFVASWGGRARGQGGASLFISVTMLINEINSMAKKMGYKDVSDYWVKVKGKKYAETGMLNLKNTLDYIDSLNK